jgi:hypothetical protein
MKTLTLSLSALAMAIAGGLTLSAPDVQAQTAARVESQTRPNFGLLLDPPTRQSRPRQQRRWSDGTHRPGWQPSLHGPSFPHFGATGTEEVVLVDCGGNPGSGAIEAAVARLRPGGSLILRSTAGACVGLLQINKPLTVIGDAGLDPRNWDQNAAPTLQAPDGAPCVIVSGGVRVTFRDVVFAAPRAGDASCIIGDRSEILLNRVAIRYAGDRPAIFVEGGLLDLRDVEVDAETLSPAIVADRASVNADELWVTKALSGMEITAGDGPISRLNRVRLVGSYQQSNFGPRPVGLSILASRQQDLVEVTNSKICGYPDALILEGAKFRIDRSRICGTLQAVTVHGGEALIENSRIVADELGVEVDAGVATLRGNVFGGNGYPANDRRSGVIVAENNHVWSTGQQCAPSYIQVYGNRYAPVWNRGSTNSFGPGYVCHNTAYPRQWWQQDEADLGIPYNPRVVWPDNYQNFQRGRGWYDCRARYVDNVRYFDDERWYQGPLGFNRDCPRPRGYSHSGISGGFQADLRVADFEIDFGARFAIGD